MSTHIESSFKFSRLLLAVILLLAGGLSADAQYIVNQTAKLLPADGAEDDRFGMSVAISGTTMIVGASFDDDNGDRSGSAYLFDVTTGLQIKLLPTDGAPIDYFGNAVAISGTTAIVGARGDDDNGFDSGSAYLFDTTTGQQILKLLPDDGEQYDNFGSSVAISGTTALVGATSADSTAEASGAAYLFNTSTGEQIAKLLPDDGAWAAIFGYSVAISGSTAIVGAPHENDYSGAAYLFNTNGERIAKLLPDGGAPQTQFGFSVAISGTVAIVGSYWEFDDVYGDRSGSAYIFEKIEGVWTEVRELLPNDGAARFGKSVAISRTVSGTVAIVGAKDHDNGESSGAAYLFDTTTGQQIAKLLPDDGAMQDLFGTSVGIAGSTAIVGALYDDDNGRNSGSAYLFDEPSKRITVTANSTPRLVTTEFGDWDEFTIVLDTQPSADVTIDVSTSDASEGKLEDPGSSELVESYTLTFNDTNWNEPQTVTVVGVDDQDIDDDVLYTIITAAAISDDEYYGGQDACDIGVVNQNDENAIYVSDDTFPVSIPDKGTATSSIFVPDDFLITDVNVTLNIFHERFQDLDVYLIAPDGTAVELFTDRGGTDQGFFDVTLDDETHDYISAYSAPPPGTYQPEGHLGDFDGASSFGTWTLEVTDDRNRMTGDILFWSLEFRGEAFDPTPGISVTPTSGLVTTEGGGTDTFTVVLDTEPTAEVRIVVSTSNGSEGKLEDPGSSEPLLVESYTLTFDNTNWNQPQTVTVVGVDDLEPDRDIDYTINLAASGGDYEGLTADVSVTNEDDEPTGGGTAVYSSDDLDLPILDRKNTFSTINIADDYTILGMTVNLYIDHGRLSDLTATLTGPDGTSVALPNVNGDDNDVSDDFRFLGSLGDWTLKVRDNERGKTGTLNSWSITIDY